MSDLRFVAIIPARYASTRFPGKPLVDIGGKTMIQRVYDQVSKVLDDVYVATDDKRIFDKVRSFGGKVIMTSDAHRSGTDRCYEAFTKLEDWFDVVINVQGDEPFIQPEQIEALKNCFADDETQIATLVKKITDKDGVEVLFNPNSPKVVIDKQNNALYFSRSPIPYKRGSDEKNWMAEHDYYKHVGVYAYRSEVLSQIVQMPPSKLELAESLEQLRWLENGLKIKAGFTDVETVGIDTPEDLEKIKGMF
ncbi:MAG: 3-deoxy-manno-octulosonate cytidylyltransferase [Paludibacter sp.]|jgi:3-deoxy-manno-octulosonate cytidylyltransferase (CMP-KDO synthetase)|nr:3-deoxy-manno-octulosonate cytidylyltransferase [Paludibacter sp.]